MFDEVRFTGTINLGNIINALVFIITSIGVYYRVKAEFIKRQDQGEKRIADQIKDKLLPGRRHSDKRDPDPPL